MNEKEEKQIFTPTQFHVQEGDIITSKKGILQHSPLTREYFLVKKFRILGNGHSICEGNKEKIDVHPVKKKGVKPMKKNIKKFLDYEEKLTGKRLKMIKRNPKNERAIISTDEKFVPLLKRHNKYNQFDLHDVLECLQEFRIIIDKFYYGNLRDIRIYNHLKEEYERVFGEVKKKRKGD